MTEEKMQQIAVYKKKINKVNKLRIILLCLSAFLLVIVYFADKQFAGVDGFEIMRYYIYTIVAFLVFVMLICTCVKAALIIKHNKIVKNS